jgi:hypothetical protein
MAKVYLSSTFSDLEDCRKQVYEALRQMRHDVIAMEDYTASDERPVAKSLADVESCEVYVGILAWRYGYVPSEKNPEQQSITEMELRRAQAVKKPCLIFLVDETAPWPRFKMEKGDGEQRLLRLREELGKSKVVRFFTNAADLAMKVSTSIANWENEQRGKIEQSAPKPPPAPQYREINHHALLAYSGADEPFALHLGKQLEPYRRSLFLSRRALFASQPEDFQELERQVRQCHTAVVILSDPANIHLLQQADRSRQVLEMLRSRTGHLILLCRSEGCLAKAAEWGPSQVIDASSWGTEAAGVQILEVDRAIAAGCQEGRTGTVGLPFVVIAMKDSEARQLAEQQDLLEQKLGAETYRRFLDLIEALKFYGASSSWMERYGPTREDWQPFAGSSRTIGKVIESVVAHLNELDPGAAAAGRAIKVQRYPLDELMEKDRKEEELPLRGIYREISQTGCVVLVDELSMFHPRVRSSFLNSPLANSELATLVTISPFDPYQVPVNEILEIELRRRLAVAFDRFTLDYDPLCELGVGSEQRLKRWFHGSLPEALRNLGHPRPNRRKVKGFELSVNPEKPVQGAAMVYSPGKTF